MKWSMVILSGVLTGTTAVKGIPMHIDDVFSQSQHLLNTEVEIEGVFFERYIRGTPKDEHWCYLASSLETNPHDVNTISLDFSHRETNRIAPLYAIRLSGQLRSHQAPVTITGLLQQLEDSRLRLTRITKLVFELPHSISAQMYLGLMGLSSETYRCESVIEYGDFISPYGPSRGKVYTSWSVDFASKSLKSPRLIVSETLDEKSIIPFFDTLVTVEGILILGSTDPEPPHPNYFHLCTYRDYDDIAKVDIKHSIRIVWPFAEGIVSEVAPEYEPVRYLNPARFTGYLRRSTVPDYIAELNDITAFSVMRESFL